MSKMNLVAALLVSISAIGKPALAVMSNSSRPPNVVLFYADDLGWGDLGVNNSDREWFRHTPNIDKLFERGIRLENYMTHCVCSPSRAGLLTGKHYASVSAGPATGGTLPNDIPNIAKDFKAAGYVTGAFGKWHNSMPNFPEGGNGQRFDYNKDKVWSELHREHTCDLANGMFDNHKGWEWGEGVNAYGFDRWVGYYNGGGDLFDRYVDWHHDIDWWHDRRYVPDEKGYTTDLITKYAVDFIRNNEERPFFCYIPHEAVHHPLQVKLADLKALCRHFPGQWEYVRHVVSPTTRRKIEDVDEIRCDRGAEFDAERIDPGRKRFHRLIYATYLYSLDQSVGKVVEEIAALGLRDRTIFMFTADNGATHDGCNLPFRGSKHTLWEGGVHVPAAIWWRGNFDANTAPFTPENNRYMGLISYLDVYPTLLSMAGQSCRGQGLEGINYWPSLKRNLEIRSGISDVYYWMWTDHGAIRTDRWKLLYSESNNKTALYDLDADVSEELNVADAHPEVVEGLASMYGQWIARNDYSVSYLPVAAGAVTPPAPEGDVLEVKATQTARIDNGFHDGVYLRIAGADGWGEALGKYIDTGDRLEYDLYVSDDSEVTSGISYCAGKGWDPFFSPGNGINQDGESPSLMRLPQGKWIRQVIGIGNMCPQSLVVSYIALQSRRPGRYHFYLDNVVVRRHDGTIRKALWASEEDSDHLIIRHKKKNYNGIQKAVVGSRMPFRSISLETVDVGSVE